MPERSAAFRNELSGQAARFRRLLVDPAQAQGRQLRSILDANAACAYGKRYGFASIEDYAEYRRRVPVVTYEDLRADIDRLAEGEQGLLTAEPVIAFEETGGSSGGAKLIPYTRSGLDAFRRALLPWLDDLYSHCPSLADGTAYWSVSPACREHRCTRGGTPVGLESDAAYFGAALAPAILESLSVPASVGALRDFDEWRRLTAFHLLADEDLGLVSVWSPTFLLELLHYARAHATVLTDAIARGDAGVTLLHSSDAGLGRCPASPARAHAVREHLESAPPRFDLIWPRLRLISCWDHASSHAYADQVRQYFPGVTLQGKGLLATEAVVSIPLIGLPFPVLAPDSAFYEFRNAHGAVCLAHEIEDGAEYELALTTASGLYRYAIGDRVRVRGHAEGTPMLEFIGRAGVVSDLCGEKISEDFVISALRCIGARFAAVVPEAGPVRGYTLLLDARETSAEEGAQLATRLDERLCVNPQYGYARRLGQLAPLRCARCVQPLERWVETRLSRGQLVGDIKPPALYAAEDWRDVFGCAT
ncbi:MAG: GH3 auxin-responsive promoter family protein [Burkholderiales bacterium]